MTPPSDSPRRDWAGLPVAVRRDRRRELLIDAAFALVDHDLHGITVRATTAQARMNARYFYESFDDVDTLILALYDRLDEDLQQRLAPFAHEPSRRRLENGIRTVLNYVTEDRRRGVVLFTGGHTLPGLQSRRAAAEQRLLSDALVSLDAIWVDPESVRTEVACAMFIGSMNGLVRDWAMGELGSDIDDVVRNASRISEAIFGVGRHDNHPSLRTSS